MSYYTQQVCLNCLPSSLPRLRSNWWTASSYPCAPDLLHKPILTACPCLNRPTRASVLSGYTDSVVDKVLILPPKQVHQESEPSKGVRFLESSVAAIVYHAPQLLVSSCFALPVTFSCRQADRV